MKPPRLALAAALSLSASIWALPAVGWDEHAVFSPDRIGLRHRQA